MCSIFIIYLFLFGMLACPKYSLFCYPHMTLNSNLNTVMYFNTLYPIHPGFCLTHLSFSQDTFPCLEELRMECNANMKEIWHGQLPEGYFKLKVL